jgi:predicted ATPase
MRIESITLKNYKALQDVALPSLPPYAVFVGPNGSGKTTLFDCFGFLKDCLTNNVRSGLQKRGGYKEVVSRTKAGEPIVIELQFRMPIVGIERLVTYHLRIEEKKEKPVVAREILRYKRGRYGSPYHFLDFAYGEGYAVTNEEDFEKTEDQLDREPQKLESPDILAIKGVGQFQRFKAASALRQLLENWHVSDFHINMARGDKDTGYAEHLSVTGDNLPLVAYYLHEKHPKVFAAILKKMKRRVPGIADIEAKATDDGRLLLKYRDGQFVDPFIDRYVSDGTVKMFAYLVLLHDPSPHPLLCVEEPENQLYPQLMGELAEEFREYAQRGGQVLVSTHSPDFLNAVRLEEIYWLAKDKGFTAIRRAMDDDRLRALVDEGDLPGALWKQKLFEGVNLA